MYSQGYYDNLVSKYTDKELLIECKLSEELFGMYSNYGYHYHRNALKNETTIRGIDFLFSGDYYNRKSRHYELNV